MAANKNILGISNKGSDLEKIINETKSGMSFDFNNYDEPPKVTFIMKPSALWGDNTSDSNNTVNTFSDEE